jgi:hypothetical protein
MTKEAVGEFVANVAALAPEMVRAVVHDGCPAGAGHGYS